MASDGIGVHLAVHPGGQGLKMAGGCDHDAWITATLSHVNTSDMPGFGPGIVTGQF
jgi:hypothetical protein